MTQAQAEARRFDVALSARWEPIAASLCLAQVSEPLFAPIAASQGLTEPPEAARILFLPVFAFLGWSIWRERAEAWRTLKAVPLLLALLLFAALSTFWSIDGGATLRRVVWLAMTMGFGLYLAWRYAWEDLIGVMAGAFLALALGSFALALAMPAAGIMTTEHPGAWCGLWTHKNTLGGFMAVGAPLCAATAFMNPDKRKLWAFTAFLCFALVLLSTSKTALLATFIGFAVMFACAFARKGPLQTLLLSAGLASIAIIGAAIVFLAPDLLVGALGRDLTLTGRTDIWQAAAPAVAVKPWLGYGYYAFWLPTDGPAYWVREAVRWQVASAHSGWLETALGMGRIGVALFALQLIATWWRGARAIADPVAGLWAPAFLVCFTLYTMSESHVLQANDLFWCIYAAVAAKLALGAFCSPVHGGAVAQSAAEGGGGGSPLRSLRDFLPRKRGRKS